MIPRRSKLRQDPPEPSASGSGEGARIAACRVAVARDAEEVVSLMDSPPVSEEELHKQVHEFSQPVDFEVLRVVVPLRSKTGAECLKALQQVVSSTHRLGIPVRRAHSDRAAELSSPALLSWCHSHLIQHTTTNGTDPQSNGLAERLIGWFKSRARVLLEGSGMGVQYWPLSMQYAEQCQHGHVFGKPNPPMFGQKMLLKYKQATNKPKQPFKRWEEGRYLTPFPAVSGGHLLLKVKCVSDLLDSKAEMEQLLPVREAEDLAEPAEVMEKPAAPTRRVREKAPPRVEEEGAIRAQLGQEILAEAAGHEPRAAAVYQTLLAVVSVTRSRAGRRMWTSATLGAYTHGGFKGLTKDALDNPALCRCLNQFLRTKVQDASASWTSIAVTRAGDVPLHSDSWNHLGSADYAVVLRGKQFLWHTQGDLPGAKLARDLTPPGAADEGFVSELIQKGKAVKFNPRLPHAVVSMPDIVVSAYTPNNWDPPSAEFLGSLKDLGFPVGQSVSTAQVLGEGLQHAHSCIGAGVGVPTPCQGLGENFPDSSIGSGVGVPTPCQGSGVGVPTVRQGSGVGVPALCQGSGVGVPTPCQGLGEGSLDSCHGQGGGVLFASQAQDTEVQARIRIKEPRQSQLRLMYRALETSTRVRPQPPLPRVTLKHHLRPLD